MSILDFNCILLSLNRWSYQMTLTLTEENYTLKSEGLSEGLSLDNKCL